MATQSAYTEDDPQPVMLFINREGEELLLKYTKAFILIALISTYIGIELRRQGK
jgi:hypothetical protein